VSVCVCVVCVCVVCVCVYGVCVCVRTNSQAEFRPTLAATSPTYLFGIQPKQCVEGERLVKRT